MAKRNFYVDDLERMAQDADRYRFIRDHLRPGLIADLAAMKRDWWASYIDKQRSEHDARGDSAGRGFHQTPATGTRTD